MCDVVASDLFESKVLKLPFLLGLWRAWIAWGRSPKKSNGTALVSYTKSGLNGLFGLCEIFFTEWL